MQVLTLSVKLFIASYKLWPSSTEGTGGIQGIGGGAGGGQKLGVWLQSQSLSGLGGGQL